MLRGLIEAGGCNHLSSAGVWATFKLLVQNVLLRPVTALEAPQAHSLRTGTQKVFVV